MLIKKLKLHNFKSYIDDVIYFSDVGATTIYGESGRGKTTIIQALKWGLWGITDEYLKSNFLNYNIKEKMEIGDEENVFVEITLEAEGREYKITRGVQVEKGLNGKIRINDRYDCVDANIKNNDILNKNMFNLVFIGNEIRICMDVVKNIQEEYNDKTIRYNDLNRSCKLMEDKLLDIINDYGISEELYKVSLLLHKLENDFNSMCFPKGNTLNDCIKNEFCSIIQEMGFEWHWETNIWTDFVGFENMSSGKYMICYIAFILACRKIQGVDIKQQLPIIIEDCFGHLSNCDKGRLLDYLCKNNGQIILLCHAVDIELCKDKGKINTEYVLEHNCNEYYTKIRSLS